MYFEFKQEFTGKNRIYILLIQLVIWHDRQEVIFTPFKFNIEFWGDKML